MEEKLEVLLLQVVSEWNKVTRVEIEQYLVPLLEQVKIVVNFWKKNKRAGCSNKAWAAQTLYLLLTELITLTRLHDFDNVLSIIDRVNMVEYLSTNRLLPNNSLILSNTQFMIAAYWGQLLNLRDRHRREVCSRIEN